MNNFLKQSTAVTKKLGPFVDATDGVTAKTSLTIAQADIRLSKNGGAFAQTNNATGATHDEAGYYGVPLDATDVGTLGSLLVSIAVSGALPVWKEFMVVPANVYDAMVLGTDYLQADAVQIEGADATDTINAQCDTAISDVGLTSTITGRIDAAISTRATVTAIWDALTSTLSTASSIGKLIVDNLNAAITSRAATGAKMDIVDAPNATAVTALQAGLATPTNITAASGIVLDATQAAYAPAKAGEAMALTSDERTTLTTAIWAALTSGLTAVGSIGEWILAKLDATITSRNATAPLDASATEAAAAAAIAAAALATAADLGAMDAKIDIIQVAAVLSRKLRTGNVRDKSGVPGTIEILDDDGTTVIATIALSETTPYQAVTLA